MTWSHDRGLKPLIKAASAFQKLHSKVDITWDARSLADFELYPLNKLAAAYDFMMIDHPHIGTAYAQKLLLPLDELLPASFMADQEKNSVGLSHKSYYWKGHQWALAADAAAQFSAYRQDLLDTWDILPPVTWQDVLRLGESLPDGYIMGIPFVPIHAYSSFFSLCAQLSPEPFWSNGQPLSKDVGIRVLQLLRKLMGVVDQDSYDMDPIQLLDKMAHEDQLVYCPLVYGYSTYSLEGFAKRRIKFNAMPSDTGKPNGSMIGGVGLAISSQCKHPEIAAQFLGFTLSGEFQCHGYVDHFGQPGYRSAWLDEHVNEQAMNFYHDTLTTMDLGSMRPRFDGYIGFQEKAGNMIRGFFMDERKDDEAFIHTLNGLFLDVYTH